MSCPRRPAKTTWRRPACESLLTKPLAGSRLSSGPWSSCASTGTKSARLLPKPIAPSGPWSGSCKNRVGNCATFCPTEADMMPGATGLAAHNLDDYIEAYELAQAGDGHAELADFLPEPTNPLYRSVLCELIRVDLEYSWKRGTPKTLADYLQLFPQLNDDSAALQGIAFEEGRLRQQALQAEAPAAKREEYAIETVVRPALQHATRWFPSQIEPPAPSAGCGGDLLPPSFAQGHAGSSGATFEEAASAYREFRRCFDAGDARAEEIWGKSFSDGVGHAGIFRELHDSSPEAADRLAHAMTAMPDAGMEFLGFRLVHELGRGAFARVFLARQ